MRPDIWIPEKTPSDVRDRLGSIATVHLFAASGPVSDPDAPADLLVAAYDVDRAIEVAGMLRHLRVVQAVSAGVDGILGRIASGVVLCDAAGVHDIPVAEWVVMTILASRRRLPEHLAAQRTGTWGMEELTGLDLDGATVLLVGAGAIGTEVAARLAPFGVRIVKVARRARDDVRAVGDLPVLLPDADVVVILLPLTPDTRGLVNAKFLASMRAGAFLVNASRGAVVDTAALTEAVLARRIHAVLDVTDPEPLPEGHPLWSAPGALITPHVASDVTRQDERAWQLAFEQVQRLAQGEPLVNVVMDGY
jgi:phosphoglycerate dehydrogenase-like enzyme